MDKEKAKLLVEKIKATQLLLSQIEAELVEVLGEDVEEPEKVLKIEETFLGDDGKEHKKKEPYLKAKQWYCCGKPLVKEGNVYVCQECGSKYRA